MCQPQVRALESQLRAAYPHLLAEHTGNGNSSSSSNGSTEGLAAEVTVSTVDAYQGREADVVVFSAVRCV